MKSQWGKRNACKFASDAVLNGDWTALFYLITHSGASADCKYPSDQPQTLNIVTWANRYNANHPRQDLVKHDLKAEISYGTPLLHQVVMAEGVTNKKSFRPGLKVLLDAGADIDAQDLKHGYTALHVACKLCRTSLVEYLLANKADRTIEDYDGRVATDLFPRWCKMTVRYPPNEDDEN